MLGTVSVWFFKCLYKLLSLCICVWCFVCQCLVVIIVKYLCKLLSVFMCLNMPCLSLYVFFRHSTSDRKFLPIPKCLRLPLYVSVYSLMSLSFPILLCLSFVFLLQACIFGPGGYFCNTNLCFQSLFWETKIAALSINPNLRHVSWTTGMKLPCPPYTLQCNKYAHGAVK